MMNRLHCTWTELKEQPAAVMAVFQAFADGEADAARSQRMEQKHGVRARA